MRSDTSNSGETKRRSNLTVRLEEVYVRSQNSDTGELRVDLVAG